MAASRLSISQCGYNTALDIVRAGVPALVVPFADGGETEQTDRARRLEALGALRVLPAGRLNAMTLAASIEETLTFEPARLALDLDGANGTARLVTGAGPRLTTCRLSAHVGSMTAWLDPVRRALASDLPDVTFFFRDDDAGWEDDELYRLLDVVTWFRVPLALAAIPTAIGPRLAADLRSLRDFRRLDDLGASAWLRARQSRAGRPQIRVRPVAAAGRAAPGHRKRPGTAAERVGPRAAADLHAALEPVHPGHD